MTHGQNNNTVNLKKSQDSESIDRVILGKPEADLLSNWVQDFNKKADGLIKVSKADIVNSLIANHTPKLSTEELQSLASRKFDEARWLGWAMLKMKEAKKKGEHLSFDELTVFRNSLLSPSCHSMRKNKSSKASPPTDHKESPPRNESARKAEKNSTETTQEYIGEK